jgi:hypothetical protein
VSSNLQLQSCKQKLCLLGLSHCLDIYTASLAICRQRTLTLGLQSCRCKAVGADSSLLQGSITSAGGLRV